MSDFDRRKMLDLLVDPEVSSILAELEHGEKTAAHVSEKLGIPEKAIMERIAYAAEHGFVVVRQDGTDTVLGVDGTKLNGLMESEETFDGVVKGLTELDQFLN